MTLCLKELTKEETSGSWGYLIETCPSTMDLAWELADQGFIGEYEYVRAKNQTQGRGQFGRQWVSKPGNLSVTLRLLDEAHTLDTLLPLAMALCVADALEALCVRSRIKWPNDIMCGSAKIGGILIEKKGPVIMAGIGVNVCEAPQSSRTENFFHIQAGCLKKSGVNLEPSELWHLILTQIKHAFSGMMAAPLLIVEKINERLAFREEAVTLADAGTNSGPARILCIGQDGCLIIETIHGVKSIRQARIFPRVG